MNTIENIINWDDFFMQGGIMTFADESIRFEDIIYPPTDLFHDKHVVLPPGKPDFGTFTNKVARLFNSTKKGVFTGILDNRIYRLKLMVSQCTAVFFRQFEPFPVERFKTLLPKCGFVPCGHDESDNIFRLWGKQADIALDLMIPNDIEKNKEIYMQLIIDGEEKVVLGYTNVISLEKDLADIYSLKEWFNEYVQRKSMKIQKFICRNLKQK